MSTRAILPCKLVLDEELIWDSGVKGVYFLAPDALGFKIINGIWYIPQGWIWDGTTGVPDGPEDPNKPGYPITWKASLIHDIGCKYWYYKCFPYKRGQIDKFFFYLLGEVNFEFKRLYYVGVHAYGLWVALLYHTLFSKLECTQ